MLRQGLRFCWKQPLAGKYENHFYWKQKKRKGSWEEKNKTMSQFKSGASLELLSKNQILPQKGFLWVNFFFTRNLFFVFFFFFKWKSFFFFRKFSFSKRASTFFEVGRFFNREKVWHSRPFFYFQWFDEFFPFLWSWVRLMNNIEPTPFPNFPPSNKLANCLNSTKVKN